MEQQRTRVYFASDIHLGSDFFEDTRSVEKRFVRWLDSIKQDAKSLYLLGDIFDYWFEYKYVIPKGFSRFQGKIAELTDAGIEVHFFTGNHDVWFFDYFPEELGVHVHSKELVVELSGKKLFLAHGDGLGDNSFSFRMIRSAFHSKVCQKLYSCIHPRWSTAFAYSWSRHSREQGLEMQTSEYKGEDNEPLVLYAKEHLKEHPEIDFFVFGHRHIMLDLMLTKKSRMLILGDWLQFFSYAVLNEQGEMELATFEE